jgi:hypothetical protein
MTARIDNLIYWAACAATVFAATSAFAGYKHCPAYEKGETRFMERQGETPVWTNGMRGDKCIYYYRTHRDYYTTKYGRIRTEKLALQVGSVPRCAKAIQTRTRLQSQKRKASK